MPSASRSWKNSAVYFSAIFQGSSCSLRAASSILSLAVVGVVVADVADVGDVHDLRDLVAAQLEPAPQDVGEQEGAEVADVRPAVDRRAAVVHAHPGRRDRLEGSLRRVSVLWITKAMAAIMPSGITASSRPMTAR